jgi:hypothetical protein
VAEDAHSTPGEVMKASKATDPCVLSTTVGEVVTLESVAWAACHRKKWEAQNRASSVRDSVPQSNPVPGKEGASDSVTADKENDECNDNPAISKVRTSLSLVSGCKLLSWSQGALSAALTTPRRIFRVCCSLPSSFLGWLVQCSKSGFRMARPQHSIILQVDNAIDSTLSDHRTDSDWRVAPPDYMFSSG